MPNKTTRRTYYDELELEADASELDIKKAYRRLALLHHPDRISNEEQKEAATERFQAISQAFQVLSDPTQRAQYDAMLRSGTHVSTSSSSYHGNSSPHLYHTPPFMDAYAQFNHLFRNDAFFRQAFDGMEQEFAQQFPLQQQQKSQQSQRRSPSNREGWIPWLLRQCGIQFSMTTYTTGPNGSVTARSYQSSKTHDYTDRRTRSYIDPKTGHVITVRSMEQNGNLMEEYFDNGILLQRRVNGQPQQHNTTIGSTSPQNPVVVG